MTSSSRAKRLIRGSIIALGIALLIDRLALYTWSLSVVRQYQRYRTVAARATSPDAPAVSLLDITEPPLFMQGAAGSRDISLSFEQAFARPDSVSTVNANRSISLIYLPPALAWTTRIFPLRPNNLPYRFFRSKDHYAYRLIARHVSEHAPLEFKLFRESGDSQREVPSDIRFPELFP